MQVHVDTCSSLCVSVRTRFYISLYTCKCASSLRLVRLIMLCVCVCVCSICIASFPCSSSLHLLQPSLSLLLSLRHYKLKQDILFRPAPYPSPLLPLWKSTQTALCQCAPFISSFFCRSESKHHYRPQRQYSSIKHNRLTAFLPSAPTLTPAPSWSSLRLARAINIR